MPYFLRLMFLSRYAWTLTDYWRVVLLDMDSLVLGSFDALFRTDASLLYTCDYNMMAQGVRAKLALQQEHQEGADAAVRACPVQGGFAVVSGNFQRRVTSTKSHFFPYSKLGGKIYLAFLSDPCDWCFCTR